MNSVLPDLRRMQRVNRPLFAELSTSKNSYRFRSCMMCSQEASIFANEKVKKRTKL